MNPDVTEHLPARCVAKEGANGRPSLVFEAGQF
jgi:hypothetical protein